MAGAAGVVSQAAAALFSRQTQASQAQMQDSLKKLVSTQYLMTSIALTRGLPEDVRPQEVGEINQHLRRLMDVLHSADVDSDVKL